MDIAKQKEIILDSLLLNDRLLRVQNKEKHVDIKVLKINESIFIDILNIFISKNESMPYAQLVQQPIQKTETTLTMSSFKDTISIPIIKRRNSTNGWLDIQSLNYEDLTKAIDIAKSGVIQLSIPIETFTQNMPVSTIEYNDIVLQQQDTPLILNALQTSLISKKLKEIDSSLFIEFTQEIIEIMENK